MAAGDCDLYRGGNDGYESALLVLVNDVVLLHDYDGPGRRRLPRARQNISE